MAICFAVTSLFTRTTPMTMHPPFSHTQEKRQLQEEEEKVRREMEEEWLKLAHHKV